MRGRERHDNIDIIGSVGRFMVHILGAIADMRRVLATGEPPGPRRLGAKCRACGYHPVCWNDEEGHRATDRSGGDGA